MRPVRKVARLWGDTGDNSESALSDEWRRALRGPQRQRLDVSGHAQMTANHYVKGETHMADAYKQATGSTMSTGAPAPSDLDSLTIGPDGPILLHDVHFLEQMAHFNREKVPERQPHAKGAGAFGILRVTEDVSAFTRAALFRKGATTDMLARFSTVAG